ncbi:MAG: lamin tail domain-containing protein [Deltaproteobacteria bacterium]|nr:lamin tail domain-containing protein [Deltaproteobacteria bacterium]
MKIKRTAAGSTHLSKTLVGSVSTAAIACVTGCSDPGRVGESARGLAGDGVVISAVYGGGGNTGATFRNDFIELFNRSNVAVSLDGLSLQYGSAAGNFGSSSGNILLFASGILVPPGGAHLALLSGGANGAAVPAGDTVGTLDLAQTSGKVALARVVTSLGCGAARCPTTDIVDMVGYGTASDFEGSAATAVLNATKSLQRKAGGCTDTQESSSDFDVVTPASLPRNSSTSPTPCGAQVDAGAPDATAPDATAPDATAPDATAPDATAPDATAPDATAPDATALDAAALDATAPDAGAPDATAPDAAVFDAGPSEDGGVSTLGEGLVISQFYGGGGNSGAIYSNDFVELYNPTTSPISLTGLSIQYGSATGNFANPPPDGGVSNSLTVLPDVTIQPGQYFLVQMASGGAVGDPLPAVGDFDSISNLGSANGKVALARVTESLGCGATPCPRDDIVDLVGYGTANDFEGAAAPALDSTHAAVRAGGGCQDSDNNSLDFVSATPAPRNTSVIVACGASPTDAGVTDSGVRPDAVVVPDSGPAQDGSATSDAGMGSPDAQGLYDSGRPSSSSKDAGRAAERTSETSGCSCEATELTRSSSGLFSALFVLMGLAWRRRTHR